MRKNTKTPLRTGPKFWDEKRWPSILLRFLLPLVFSIISLVIASRSLVIADKSLKLAQKQAAQPDIAFDFETVEWKQGSSVLAANENMIRLPSRFPIEGYTYNQDKINKVTIINRSNVIAKNVSLEMQISKAADFVFAAITVGTEFYPIECWRPGLYTNVDYTYLKMTISHIRKDEPCGVYFVVGYPKKEKAQLRPESVPNAIVIRVDNDQQKELVASRSFPLWY